MTGSPPLLGLRVIDATDDLGRFATKLLVELGADVVRTSTAGSSGHPMAQPEAAARGGVLDWWYDGGKRFVPCDLATGDGVDRYRRLAERADLIIDTNPPGELASLGVSHHDLATTNPRLVQVSLTPFGQTGPWSRWATSDLVAGALGGVLSVTGTPDRPLNSWGRQNYNFGGYLAAITGLSGVFSARKDGVGKHVDVSLHEVVAFSIENILMQWFFDDLLDIPKEAQRQGSLHWLRAYELAAGKTGHIMITPTPTPDLMLEWMIEKGFDEAAEFLGRDVMELLDRIDDLMALTKRFVAQFDASELWWEAQNRHVAFGGVQSVEEVAQNSQFEHRDFYADVDWDGPQVRMPARLVRMPQAAQPSLRPPAETPESLETALGSWTARAEAASDRSSRSRPLEGLRVADFTWVLAGPFATRLLGDLGADVIKIQTEERATSVNDPAFPYYFVWNRAKRSASLDMKHPRALDMARRLIEKSDILIENYSAGVLASWGLDWETVHAWNPRLIYVTMSGCGHDGPWKHVISYAPTVHAVCGLTHLTNPPEVGDVGLGFSLNDHAAGFTAALTVLAAVEARERTGDGMLIDMAQLEIGSYLIGPALIDHFANGIDAEPAGNRDGLQDHVPNEVYRAADGHVAISCTSDEQFRALATTTGIAELSDPSLVSEEQRRAHRDQIDQALAAWVQTRPSREVMTCLQDAGVPAGVVQSSGDLADVDQQLAAREAWSTVDHPLYGERTTDRFPALWDGQPLPAGRRSPYLGEHNFEVWTDIAGLEFDEVAEGIGDGLFR